MTVPLGEAIAAMAPEIMSHRREFHAHPELGFEEERTSERLIEILESYGLQPERMAKTGVVLTIPGGMPGRTLLVRADIDALPIQELGTSSYVSVNQGIMHACGHDAHMAMLLAVAKVMAARMPALPGNLKLMFQPAEEGPGGALPMIEAGILENPRVDGAFALHVWNSLPVGKVGYRSGPVMANTDQFDLVIEGQGGHGAMPHLSVDAIAVAGHVICALQTIVSRNVSPLDSAVVTLGKIQGGDRHNIIAQTVTISGTVRSFSSSLRELLPQRIEAIVAGVTKGLGATYRLDYQRTYPATVNDPAMTQILRRAAAKVLDPENVEEVEPSMGGEDMAYILERVPGSYFFVGTANPAKGLNHPHHHPSFDIDEDGMLVGTKVLVQAIEDYLTVDGI